MVMIRYLAVDKIQRWVFVGKKVKHSRVQDGNAKKIKLSVIKRGKEWR